MKTTQVQSLIFDSSIFNEEKAKEWATKHGFIADKTDITEESVRVRQAPPESFEEGSFRTIELTEGVKAIVGHPSGAENVKAEKVTEQDKHPTHAPPHGADPKKELPESSSVPSLNQPPQQPPSTDLRDPGIDPPCKEKEDEEKKKRNFEVDKTKRLAAVEIFSAGTWNGDKYTTDDLDEMIRAYNENSKYLKPAVKLGHDEDQKLLQNSGMPSAGWVSKLYRMGKKLYADFENIPSKIYELLKTKAYRKVSCEVYWDMSIDGRKYKRALGAVAFLGQEMPAVMNLADILSLYALEGNVINRNTVKLYTSDLVAFNIKKDITREVNKMNEEEAKKLQAENEELKAKLFAFEQKAKEAVRENELLELEKAGLVTPATKPLVALLLDEDKKTYSLEEGKESTRLELITKIFKLHAEAQAVNLNETTVNSKPDAGKTKEELLDEKIRQYANENKVTYSVAYKAVMKTEGGK